MPRVLAEWEARHPDTTRRVMSGFLLVYYAGLIVTGAVGLWLPGDRLAAAAGAAAYLWSAMTITMATLGIVGRLTRSVDAESIALVTLAALTLAHGVMVWAGAPIDEDGARVGGIQTGLRLITSPALMLWVAHEMRRPTIRITPPPEDDR